MRDYEKMGPTFLKNYITFTMKNVKLFILMLFVGLFIGGNGCRKDEVVSHNNFSHLETSLRINTTDQYNRVHPSIIDLKHRAQAYLYYGHIKSDISHVADYGFPSWGDAITSKLDYDRFTIVPLLASDSLIKSFLFLSYFDGHSEFLIIDKKELENLYSNVEDSREFFESPIEYLHHIIEGTPFIRIGFRDKDQWSCYYFPKSTWIKRKWRDVKNYFINFDEDSGGGVGSLGRFTGGFLPLGGGAHTGDGGEGSSNGGGGYSGDGPQRHPCDMSELTDNNNEGGTQGFEDELTGVNIYLTIIEFQNTPLGQSISDVELAQMVSRLPLTCFSGNSSDFSACVVQQISCMIKDKLPYGCEIGNTTPQELIDIYNMLDNSYIDPCSGEDIDIFGEACKTGPLTLNSINTALEGVEHLIPLKSFSDCKNLSCVYKAIEKANGPLWCNTYKKFKNNKSNKLIIKVGSDGSDNIPEKYFADPNRFGTTAINNKGEIVIAFSPNLCEIQ